ncbi:MAG: DNA repair protein RecO [Actinomycetes bacterium]
MSLYRDEGVVLRAQKLGEADRIITLLTREHGRVRAVAKGVRRTTSRIGARLEPFGHVDVQFYAGRTLDGINQVETLSSYGSVLVGDYARYTAGQAMLETAERLTPEEREPSTQQYLLLVGGLRALVGGEHDPGLVLDSYLVRSLSVAGWAPSFDACARCGIPGPHRAFNIAAGGALCAEDRVPGSAAPAMETFALLAALLTGDWHIADASDARARREASGLVTAYLNWQLERGLRSLPLVERTPNPPPPFLIKVPPTALGAAGAPH